MSRSELLGKIQGLLGGRAAEDLVFGEVSTGASNDLEKVSKIARNMIVVYGMSRQAPNMSLIDSTQQSFLGQGPGVVNHSEKLEELIDGEVQEIVESCYKEARQVLVDHYDKLKDMAGQLLQREKIDESDIVAILGPRPAAKGRLRRGKGRGNEIGGRGARECLKKRAISMAGDSAETERCC